MADPKAKRRRTSHSSGGVGPESPGTDDLASHSTLDVHSTGGQFNTDRLESQVPQPKASNGSSKTPHGSVKHKQHVLGRVGENDQPMIGNSTSGSALMDLQIDDLLKDIRPNFDKLTSQFEGTIRLVQQIIRDLPEVEPMPAIQAVKSLKREEGISVPFLSPSTLRNAQYSLEYRHPTQINAVGGLSLRSLADLEKTYTTDIAVTLPDSILQTKDFLNHRYLHKRAFYIAQIAAGIKRNAKHMFKLSFDCQDGVMTKPVLVAEPIQASPAGILHSRFRIRIICAVDPQIFPSEKTLPGKCCLRASDSNSPTPFYNACVRSDASVETYQNLLQKTALQCDAFRDVCLLGQIWLRQRGFGASVLSGGFGPSEWSILCALLLQSGGSKDRPVLSLRCTCLQLFRAAIQFLATRDLTRPLLLNGALCKIPPSQSPVFFDGGAQMNVLFKMTAWSYQLLRQEARATIGAFNSNVSYRFESVFIKRLDDDSQRFDQCFGLETRTVFEHHDDIGSSRDTLPRLYSILCRALGDRVRLVHLRIDHSSSRRVGKPEISDSQACKAIRIGLNFDSDRFERLIDHGPSADDQDSAAEFRKFWGDKAELRRFKDGSITESLLWSQDSSVVEQIISHILNRHFDLPLNAIKPLGSQIQRLIPTPTSTLTRKSAYKLVNDAYQSLTAQLRQLEGLPLSIRSILPASSQVRQASLQMPITSNPLRPIDIVIEFEGSARWPNSLPAVQRTKIAFLIKIGDLLSASNDNVTARVGLENTTGPTSSYDNTSFLDVLLPSPHPDLVPTILFRLRIHHDRTLTLLQNTLSEASSTERVSLMTALQAYTRFYLATPKHTAAMSRLTTLYSSLPTAIQLLKYWTSAHHLTNHIPEEILEILAARPYLHPCPWLAPPASAQTAFLRALDLIAQWDWVNEPLIVDLTTDQDSSGMDTEKTNKLHTRFEAWRKELDPAQNHVSWFVGTTIDDTGVVWTQGPRPLKVAANRFAALARASIDMVKNKSQPTPPKLEPNASDHSWTQIFQSPLADFDFLIHLDTKSPSRSSSTFKNLESLSTSLDPTFDPATLYLADLESVFGGSSSNNNNSNVLFFRGGDDNGSIIGGLWNPKLLHQKQQGSHPTAGAVEWRVGLGWSSVPVSVKAPNKKPKQKDKEKEENKHTGVGEAVADEWAGIQSDGGEGEGQDEDEETDGKTHAHAWLNRRGMLAEMARMGGAGAGGGTGLVRKVEVLRY
jgi:U3 small nucleolar RNA-associated protein 22